MLLTSTQSTTRTVFFSFASLIALTILDCKTFKLIDQGALSLIPLKCLRIQERQVCLCSIFTVFSFDHLHFTENLCFQNTRWKGCFCPFFGACVFVMIQVIYLRKIYLVQSSSKNLNWNFSLHYSQVEFRFNFFEHDYFDKYLLKYSDNK